MAWPQNPPPTLVDRSRNVFRDSLTVLRKQFWYALLFFALVISGVTVWTFRQVQMYDASASIIIDTQPPRVFSNVREVVELGAGSFWSNKEYYETQYKVIASRNTAEKVVEQLRLDSNPRFLGVHQIKDEAQRSQAMAAANPVALVRQYLSVEPIQDSRVVILTYRHPVPELAQQVVNTIAQVYQEENRQYRSIATVDATRELDTQFRDIKKKLEAAEDQLDRFKQANGIIGQSIELQQSQHQQQIQAIRSTLSNLQTERERLEAKLNRIRAMNVEKDWGTLDEVLSSPLLVNLKGTYLKLNQEKIQLSVDLLEKHPKRQMVEDQLVMVRQAIDEEVRALIASMERNLASLKEIEGTHRERLRKLDVELQRLDTLSTTFARLKREAEENRNLYDMVVSRLRETNLTGQIDVNNVRILDLALLPKSPSTPRTRLNLTLAVILGLLGSIAFAFLVDYMDRTIRTREDVEALGVPFLGIAPDIRPSDRTGGQPLDLYVAQHPRSSAAECARLVRTNLLFATAGGELRRIVVSSASPREGKTHTAINIAISLAQSNKRTLLIDSDMRRPRLHKVFGLPGTAGLSNLAVGRGKIEEIVQPTEVDQLFFLPCGPIPPNPAELLQTPRLREVLDDLGTRFDCIVLDSPPIMAVADPLILSQMTDGVIFVMRSGVSSRDVVFRGVQALQDVQARILGVVLNGVDITKPYYGRYYQYYRKGYGTDGISTSKDEDRGDEVS